MSADSQELLSLADEIDAAIRAGEVKHAPPPRSPSAGRPAEALEAWLTCWRYASLALVWCAAAVWLWNLWILPR